MHVLVAADVFEQRHLDLIARAVEGWATWERVGHTAPSAMYAEKLSRADVVVGWPKAQLLAASDVRFFQLLSVGYDAYVSAGLENKPDFIVCNARGALSVPVAEHCIAMMMALVRRLPRHIRDMNPRRWELATYEEVTGNTACVIGLGDIGTEIARRCKALHMTVSGIRRHPERGHPIAEPVYGPEMLKGAVSTAQHIFIAIPGETATRRLLNADVLGATKLGAYLYNVARGSVVDEGALIEHLRSGHLRGAGLDVFSEEPLPAGSPLWDMENVIVTPHTAGHSIREADRLCDLFLTNLARFRQGTPLINVVSLRSQQQFDREVATP